MKYILAGTTKDGKRHVIRRSTDYFDLDIRAKYIDRNKYPVVEIYRGNWKLVETCEPQEEPQEPQEEPQKLYLYDLTHEQIKELIQNNDGLQSDLFDIAMSNANDYVGEILSGCPASYQIGSYCQGEHFRITGTKRAFLGWFENEQRMYAFFGDVTVLAVSEMAGKDEVTPAYDRHKEIVEMYMYDALISEYSMAFDIDCLVDIFCENYIDWVTPENENLYTDTDLMFIYRDIPEIIIPAHVETVF